MQENSQSKSVQAWHFSPNQLNQKFVSLQQIKFGNMAMNLFYAFPESKLKPQKRLERTGSVIQPDFAINNQQTTLLHSFQTHNSLNIFCAECKYLWHGSQKRTRV